jgi:hypothetical protein
VFLNFSFGEFGGAGAWHPPPHFGSPLVKNILETWGLPLSVLQGLFSGFIILHTTRTTTCLKSVVGTPHKEWDPSCYIAKQWDIQGLFNAAEIKKMTLR